eukprot:15469142-Alexandrium_andersonii.AAC.1
MVLVLLVGAAGGLSMCSEPLAHLRWGEIARAGDPVARAHVHSPGCCFPCPKRWLRLQVNYVAPGGNSDC